MTNVQNLKNMIVANAEAIAVAITQGATLLPTNLILGQGGAANVLAGANPDLAGATIVGTNTAGVTTVLQTDAPRVMSADEVLQQIGGTCQHHVVPTAPATGQVTPISKQDLAPGTIVTINGVNHVILG